MLDQAVIAVCGTASVWLSQSPAIGARRWAPIIGLAAQPFWIYAAWRAEQWGIFALAFVYTAAWLRGLHTHWR